MEGGEARCVRGHTWGVPAASLARSPGSRGSLNGPHQAPEIASGVGVGGRPACRDRGSGLGTFLPGPRVRATGVCVQIMRGWAPRQFPWESSGRQRTREDFPWRPESGKGQRSQWDVGRVCVRARRVCTRQRRGGLRPRAGWGRGRPAQGCGPGPWGPVSPARVPVCWPQVAAVSAPLPCTRPGGRLGGEGEGAPRGQVALPAAVPKGLAGR